MQINHLINGKSVTSASYFETVNPATQDVLAEVAAGGEAEVHAAVAAAKEAFPKWAATPAPQHAATTSAATPVPGSFTIDPAAQVISFTPPATQTFTLTVQPGHSADVAPADGVINLTELTRVIELYNQRTGTVRDRKSVV